VDVFSAALTCADFLSKSGRIAKMMRKDRGVTSITLDVHKNIITQLSNQRDSEPKLYTVYTLIMSALNLTDSKRLTIATIAIEIEKARNRFLIG
jgi:hypothetical protein